MKWRALSSIGVGFELGTNPSHPKASKRTPKPAAQDVSQCEAGRQAATVHSSPAKGSRTGKPKRLVVDDDISERTAVAYMSGQRHEQPEETNLANAEVKRKAGAQESVVTSAPASWLPLGLAAAQRSLLTSLAESKSAKAFGVGETWLLRLARFGSHSGPLCTTPAKKKELWHRTARFILRVSSPNLGHRLSRHRR